MVLFDLKAEVKPLNLVIPTNLPHILFSNLDSFRIDQYLFHMNRGNNSFGLKTFSEVLGALNANQPWTLTFKVLWLASLELERSNGQFCSLSSDCSKVERALDLLA